LVAGEFVNVWKQRVFFDEIVQTNPSLQVTVVPPGRWSTVAVPPTISQASRAFWTRFLMGWIFLASTSGTRIVPITGASAAAMSIRESQPRRETVVAIAFVTLASCSALPTEASPGLCL
jgi:hypothetical protein